MPCTTIEKAPFDTLFTLFFNVPRCYPTFLVQRRDAGCCEKDEAVQDSAASAHEPRSRLWIDHLWHAYLEECPRATADKATVIRKALKKSLGPIEAAALLSQYKECALRVATGGCQRFIVHEEGVTMKLAQNCCNING